MTSSTKLSPTWWSRANSFFPARRLAHFTIGAALLAVAAHAVHLLQAYLLFVAVIGLATVAIDVLSLPRLAEVTAVRQIARLEVTVPAEVHIAVQIQPRKRAFGPAKPVWVRDDVPLEIAADILIALGFLVENQATVAYGIVPLRRGDAQFGDIYVRIAGAFGLLFRQFRIPAAQSVPILPDDRLTAAKRTALQRALQREGVTVRRVSGGMSEFGHIREFAVGDDPRHVNWFATARRGTLMRNVYQPERGQHVILGIDCGRTMAVAQADGKSRLDLALEAALLTAAAALRSGDEVSVIAFADAPVRHITGVRGDNGLRRILEAAYNLEARSVYASIHPVAELIHTYHKRQALLILFTDLTDLATSDLFERDIHLLERRHTCIVASFSDEALHGRMNAPAKNLREAAVIGVAAELLNERAEFRERMRVRGVEVIESRKELFSGALTAYAHYKNSLIRL